MMEPIARTKVWGALKNAWRKTIEDEYDKGRVCSEHHLQASLYANLVPEIKKINKEWIVFVEPRIGLSGESRTVVIPDLLICNSRSLICAVEVKYTPRKAAQAVNGIDKDIATLTLLANQGKELRFRNDRHHGIKHDPKHYEASELLLVWAGVYAADSKEPAKEWGFRGHKDVESMKRKRRFGSMHAITGRDSGHTDVEFLPRE